MVRKNIKSIFGEKIRLYLLSLVYFWVCTEIAVFLLFLFTLQNLPHILPSSPSNSWPFFFNNFYCMHICICMCIYVPEYNLFNLSSAICMYIFSVNCLAKNTMPFPHLFIFYSLNLSKNERH